jgi:peptidoglycan/LPS O-acetylase OafA/YrhL
MSNNRIDILDGFRVIAIFIVMLFHFYSLYIGLYNYNFDSSIFKFGYLGVEFFFMISGFVIFISLDNSKNFIEFIKKRYMRLMPAMLICSFLTFIVFNIIDDQSFYIQAKEYKNFLFSNTFLTPSLPNKVLNTNLSYTDYSYWSLWIEVIFYSLISSLYFLDKKRVILNYSIISISGTLLWYFFGTEENVLQLSIYSTINKILNFIPFINFLIWFLIGVIISKLYQNKKSIPYQIYLLFLFVLTFLTSREIELKYFTVISAVIWFVFLFKTNWLNFLGRKILFKLGRSSYSVYLIHQMVGVLTILKLSPYFGNYNWIIPIILIILFFAFGVFSFKYLEKPLGSLVAKILFKKSK